MRKLKYYGGVYHKIIEEVLERDKYRCKMCGHTSFPIVHHIDGNRKNHILDNLVTLCRTCHAVKHGYVLKFSNPNINLILELRKNGKTYEEIGDYLGITRQRVHQIIKKTFARPELLK